jgi:hypothetical protein
MKTMYLTKHLWLVGLLLIWNHLAGSAEELDFSKQKEITRSFNISLNDQLNVDNKYGNITVTHWEKNEVDIRVVIESKARNERQVQEGLDRVQIELKKTANTVYAVTSIKNTTGWNNNNNKITINYYIAMPSKLAATLSQKYGNINLPEKNEGKCNIELKYGSLNAGSFTESIDIDAGYSNVTLEDVKNLHMEVKYCGNVSLGNGENVYIDSKYSRLELHDAGKLDIDHSYGNVTVRNVNNLSIKTRYGNAHVEYVKENLKIRALDYGSLTVDKVDPNFKNIDAAARYGNLKLSISSQAAFQVTATAMKYGNVNIRGLKMISETKDKTDHHYKINGGGNASIYFDGNNYSNLRIDAL